MQKLSMAYLREHASESAPGNRAESADTFGEAVADLALQGAAKQLSGPSDEREEMQFSLPVTIRPVENAGPLENCVEVCVGGGPFQVCYHRTFKGKYPGPDDKWPW